MRSHYWRDAIASQIYTDDVQNLREAKRLALVPHSELISLSELKLEYMKSYRNAYGERMSEAQEQQLEYALLAARSVKLLNSARSFGYDTQ